MEGMFNRIHAMFLGVKIGDRWGLPVECLTRMEILWRTRGRGVSILENVSRWRTDIVVNYGATSDDWQLTAAVGWALARNSDATSEDMARALVMVMHESIMGWGGTTLSSVREREQWFVTNGQAGLAPHLPLPRPFSDGAGVGCGVAMRISSIAALCALRGFDDKELIRRCIEHGMLTHPDPRAWIGAAAIALQLVWLLRGEEQSSVEAELLRLVKALEDQERRCIDEYGGLPSHLPRVCQVLRRILDEGLIHDRDRLLAKVGNECPTFQSVPFSLATFLRCRDDFCIGILETINDGGDADSNASMVGALLGARLGLGSIPLEWIRPEDEDARTLTHALMQYR